MFRNIAYIFLAFLLIDLIVSIILGHISNFYNPQIKATYSGTVASVLGIITIVLMITSEKYGYNKKVHGLIGVVFMIASALATVFQFALGFYLGAWACIIWFGVSIMFLYLVRNSTMILKNQEFTSNNIPLNDNHIMQGPSQSNIKSN